MPSECAIGGFGCWSLGDAAVPILVAVVYGEVVLHNWPTASLLQPVANVATLCCWLGSLPLAKRSDVSMYVVV